MGVDTSLLAQHLNGRLALADSLQTSMMVRLAAILSMDEALCYLGMFSFVVFYLLSAGGRHSSAVAELLRLIDRLEEIYNKLKGVI